jgi:hypothetical protein
MISTQRFASLIIFWSSFQGVNSQGNATEIEIEAWFTLFRYLVGLGFVIFGAYTILYNDIATYIFLKKYLKATPIQGQVLSCEELPGNVKKYEIQVLYSAIVRKFASDPRLRFRYPEALLLQKEFLRRFESNWLIPRGSSVDLLLLPGFPKSGCTPEMIDAKKSQLSIARIILTIIPATSLIALFAGLSIREVLTFDWRTEQLLGWAFLIFCCGLFVCLSWSFCDFQFQARAKNIFFSAVPMQRKSTSTTMTSLSTAPEYAV